MIVQLETADPDKTLSWSTMNNYNALLGNRIRSSNVQVIQFYKYVELFQKIPFTFIIYYRVQKLIGIETES